MSVVRKGVYFNKIFNIFKNDFKIKLKIN